MSSTTHAAAFLGASVLAIAAYIHLKNRSTEKNGGENGKIRGKPADCSFDHVVPYPGDPLAVPATIYTDQVKTTPYRPAMGLSALDMNTYIELGSHYMELIEERMKVIAEQPEQVTFMLPCAKAACTEYLHYVADYCAQRFPMVFEKINEGKGLYNKATGRRYEDLDAVEEPMKVIGELIVDDVAIMTKDPTPEHPDDTKLYKYNASVNCYSFPGAMMTTKIGMVMGGVHAPVPGFNQKVLKPVNSWFDVLQSPSHRLNWFLQKDSRYFRPEWMSASAHINSLPDDKELTVDSVFYRVERQTFIRLPKTKAIVFGIRLYVNPLPEVIADAEAREKAAGPPQGDYNDPDPSKRPLKPFVERLYSAVCVMGPLMKTYKGHMQTNGVTRAWLEENRGMTEANVDRSGEPL